VQAQGSDITTIEGMANADGSLSARVLESPILLHGSPAAATPAVQIRSLNQLESTPSAVGKNLQLAVSIRQFADEKLAIATIFRAPSPLSE